WLDSGVAPGREQSVPDFGGVGVCHEHLEAVFARVPGARHGRASPGHASLRNPERWERSHVSVGLGGEYREGARPLDRDERRADRAIVQRDVFAEMREEMRAVLRDVRGIDYNHVFGVADPVDDDVVDDRPAFVGDETVARLAHIETGDVARHEAVERGARGATLEEELAHVREIEEAGAAADRAMLRDDALVLDRHLVAREGHHLRPELLMLVEQRSAAHCRRLRHHYAASLAAARARSSISR